MMKYTHNYDIDINEGGTVHMMNTHTHLGKHIPRKKSSHSYRLQC